MRSIRNSILLILTAFLACCKQEVITPKVSENRPTVVTFPTSPVQSGNPNGRIIYRNPNALVVRTNSGDLKLFPFINNTFYGNGGGGVVGTGYNYNKYFPADWDNNGKTDIVSLSSNVSLDYSAFKNGQFEKQSGVVGTGFSDPIIIVGEWATPYGGDPDTPDLMTIDYSGNITIYPFKSLPNFHSYSFQNGSSFSAGSISTNYTHYLVADWSGDGLSDIICRDINGNLDYFVFANGQFNQSSRVGHNWFFTDYFVLDITKDGIPDNLLVRDQSGNLKIFPFKNQTFYGNGGGAILGTGFNYINYFVGSWGGGLAEIIGRDQNGNMYLHSSSTRDRGRDPSLGPYGSPVLVGHGWNFTDYFIGTW
jgi:hypothetical protein